MRGTRTDQALAEWNSSGSYGHNPMVVSARPSRPRPSLWPALAASLGLSAGLLMHGSPVPPMPAPTAAPIAAVAPAPPAPEVPPPAPAPRQSSPKAARCLALGWDFYGAGAYDRASDMAMEALEAVGQERGSSLQRVQARGLLDASQEKLHRAVPQVVRVPAPHVAPVVATRPAVVVRPAIVEEAAPAQEPRVASEPAPLPRTSYPQAARRPSRVRLPVQTVALTGLQYPEGRGPGVCPNYFVNDNCECHQFERAHGYDYAPRRQTFTPSRTPSRMEQWRRSESQLGQRI